MRLAEQYHLSITVKPDGSIIGLHGDLKKLRLLLGFQPPVESLGAGLDANSVTDTYLGAPNTLFVVLIVRGGVVYLLLPSPNRKMEGEL